MDGASQKAAENVRATPADLAALRDEIGSRLVSAAGRIDALEARSQVSRTVIARAFASVAFVQGAYGFREAASGRLLRHGVGPDGRPLVTPGGQPLLTLEGDGPVAERQFTGTGFALAAPAAFVTNRHVALPWEKDASAATLADQGFEPVMVRLIAYFPGESAPIELELLRASETNDLALLAAADAAAEALAACTREQSARAGELLFLQEDPVDAFYAAAMAAGGRDNGPPGLRPRYHADYYGAFVLDPDGHNVEAVCHLPCGALRTGLSP